MKGIAELAEYLVQHDDYCIFGHVNPDGDAAGSCIALALALQVLGKRAFVYLPGGVPHMFDAFARSVTIAPAEEAPFVPQTGFSVDVSELPRLGDGLTLFETCSARAMLDHHATNPGFGDIYYVDGHAAAVGELAQALIEALGVPLNVEMATWLYIAIVTDSGRFGYDSTRPETMYAAAACLRAGIDVDMITREVYRTRSEGRTRLMGLVLSGLEMNPERTMCWARVTPEMFAAAGAMREDNEGIVNYLLEIRGVEFACLAEAVGENRTKFSLRSKQGLDVAAQVAVPIGGGGHARAAGVTLNLPLEQALECVLKQAESAMANTQRNEKCE